MIDQPISVNLKRLRTDKHLSQAALAREARVSPAYLSELESGHGTRPSGQVLMRLAEALGVTVEGLLGGPRRQHMTDQPTVVRQWGLLLEDGEVVLMHGEHPAGLTSATFNGGLATPVTHVATTTYTPWTEDQP